MTTLPVNPKFDRLMDLDRDVRVTHAQATLDMRSGARAQAAAMLPRRKAKFFAALDALTEAEMAEFSAYRRAAHEGRVA